MNRLSDEQLAEYRRLQAENAALSQALGVSALENMRLRAENIDLRAENATLRKSVSQIRQKSDRA